MYGTAWKEDRTTELTELALAAGFRAIDTANQRKHYFEAGVGEALRRSEIPRSDVYLQTKFTYQRGQDHRLPYDPSAPLGRQVEQSIRSSLEHLGCERIDSYILHGPWASSGWRTQDRDVWAAMSAAVEAGWVSALGVSNIAADQLEALCETEDHQPVFVQNRCFAATGWDRAVREICRARGIVYQGFSLLTANRRELAGSRVAAIARARSATIPQLVFRFALAVGMLPLTGTSSEAHMREDLAAPDLELTDEEVATIETIAAR